MKKLNKKGFTLIELLAVIVILAIVAAVTMTVIVPKLEKAPVDAAKSSVSNMRQQLTNACTAIGSGVDAYGTFAGDVGNDNDTTNDDQIATCQTGTCTMKFTAAQLTDMKISGEMPESAVISFNQCSITSGTVTYSTTTGQFKGIVVTISGNNITTNKD